MGCEIMSVKELKVLAEEKRNGSGKVSKDDRVKLLIEYDPVGDLSAKQLAELFGVSSRQIQYDRQDVKEELAIQAKSEELLGEAYSQYRNTLSRMDQAIEEENWQKVLALKRRFGIVQNYLNFALPYQLEDLADMLSETRETLELEDKILER